MREKTTLNGEGLLYYDGGLDTIQHNVNAGQAYIHGVSLNAEALISENWSFKTSFNYTKGRNTSAGTPLGHIPPMYGQTSVAYTKDKFYVQLLARYNAKKLVGDYDPEGSDNLDNATPDGTPAWYTLNLYADYKANKHFSFNIAVENLLDMHYRPFSSGVSGAGRNFIVTLRGHF